VTEAAGVIDAIFRREAGRVLATLIRLLGDFDLAEEAQQEAFAGALEQWPRDGVPDNPAAWLIRAARNKGIDRIRREALFRDKLAPREAAASWESRGDDDGDAASFEDDRLRLIFTCCHPALSRETQLGLTLRAVCGLSTEAVARALLVTEDTMAQRLVRAKRKIREAGIPYETPGQSALDERLHGVLAVVYSVFTEGYAPTSGTAVINPELCAEAIRLGRLLDALLPARADVLGLLALMLLHDARRGARSSSEGEVVLLEAQDRRLWNHSQIDEGLRLVERSLELPVRASRYAVEAAIVALHVQASGNASTDWPQIVGLYEVLLRIHPTPVVELNHAVAVSMVDGPARALDLIDSLAARRAATDYHLLHAARGHLLQRLGRNHEARAAFVAAQAAAKLAPERRFLAARIAEIDAGTGAPRLR
jgi:RNA polymerase sigma-70 factor, ECF subfamily